ncbi:hypothetical protein JOD69_001929 [Methylocaldum sp. RMAD-M]|jgi:hypothetical protein|nr:hypothetical protein [Methylocaldum sp. RMAD-M]
MGHFHRVNGTPLNSKASIVKVSAWHGPANNRQSFDARLSLNPETAVGRVFALPFWGAMSRPRSQRAKSAVSGH